VPSFVVAYDLSDERRRSKVRTLSKASGEHHQLSVFLLQAESLEEVITKLGPLVEHETERLLVARVRGKVLKVGRAFEETEFLL